MTQALGQSRDGTPFPITSQSYALPAGDAGTRMTVQMMIRKATGADGKEGSEHPGVRNFAIEATRGCPARDDWAQAKAIYEAVKKEIEFRGEKDETIQTPWLTLQWAAGDCDDFTTLIVSLLKSLGIPAKIETIATGADRAFCHVFPLVGIRKNGQVMEWRALDATVPKTKAGWRPPDATRSQQWGGRELSSESEETMSYLGFGLPHFVKKIAGTAIHYGEGYAAGGPAGVAAMAAQDAKRKALHKLQAKREELQRRYLSGYEFAPGYSGGLSGYEFERRHSLHERPRYARRFFEAPMPDLEWARKRWRFGLRGYDGLGATGAGDDFWSKITPEQKLIGGVAVAALLLAATR